MLQGVGIGENEERVYRSLLAAGTATVPEIAGAAEIEEVHVENALAVLERKGVVSRVPGNRGDFVPVPPDVAFEDLILKRREELEGAEFGVLQLVQEYRSAGHKKSPADLIEVLSGRAAVVHRFMQLQEATEHEVLILHKPPFAAPSEGLNPVERRLIKRGVRYRVIYDASLLDDPVELEHIRKHAGAGEESAVLKELPMKLAISDRRMALVPLIFNDPNVDESAVVIHPSMMLEALATLFEMLWERAVRFRPTLESVSDAGAMSVSALDQRLLELLATGLKDEAIARHLGIALRTVRRRVHKLIQELGANSRFQAGIEASKRGWI
jgi:sugar-specific transcriptional regulator TrmB/DNA-binding CsgD family transcriptional regulator